MGISDLAASIASRRNIRQNRWTQLLVTAVAGGIGYALIQGVQTLILAPGRAFAALVDLVAGAFESGVDQYLETTVRLWSQAWSTELDLGIVQFPYALAIVLLTFLAVAQILSVWRDS